MNLRSIDLNLLVVFDALMSTQHVTRAADRVGLSQPATSNALRRLRVVFADELLVRTPSGMQPTSRALELIEPVRGVLRQIERVFEPDQHFDPSTTERNFRVRLSDVLAMLVLPSFFKHFDLPKSRVSLDVVHLSPDRTVDALERDEIDIAISFGLSHGATILSETIMNDRMVCIVRKGHPFSLNKPFIDSFLSAKHVRVSISPTDLRFVDDILVASAKKRAVVLNVPHWLVVPQILRETDLVSVMPERLYLALADPKLVACDLPFSSSTFAWNVYWHRRQDRNPAIRWLRESLRAAVS
ncbi:LysR family transcriptional regulator [Labrys okinawensis]|uniref:LysR family transcriptional regulator n=1 Tax=Labrys okinawensis TaxID=346911 RepID=UPI0039BD48C7